MAATVDTGRWAAATDLSTNEACVRWSVASNRTLSSVFQRIEDIHSRQDWSEREHYDRR